MHFNSEDEIYNNIIIVLEQATDSKLEQEDWRLYIEICNKVIRIPNGPKTTREVLQKKLAVRNHPQTHVLALSVIFVLQLHHAFIIILNLILLLLT